MAPVTAALPANEAARLAALKRYDVLDTSAEPAFDELTNLASMICGAPISILSLVDADRQWFKSEVGLGIRELPREVAFCAHAILEDGVFVVPDAWHDDRFKGNPLVTSAPNIRFYAGSPLVTNDGYSLGTLCVIDRVPRALTDQQRRALEALSRQAIAQLELRRHVKQLQKACEQLQMLDRLKSEFVSMVSHELRTPMTSIRGALQLVLAEGSVSPDNDAHELLSTALRSSERLIRITNDILDLSKIESGRLELNPAPASIAELIATACGAVAHMPTATNRLSVRLPPFLPSVMVDGDRIVQALVNVLGNALKFTPVPELVEVSATADETMVAIHVRDRGPGISDADREKLFRPFGQLAAGRKVGGTGLGLVITRGIVEQHGGRISIASRVGEGTTFTIALPTQSP